MYALKALVLFMGLLIVMGLTLIGWGIYKKVDDPDFKFFDLGGSEQPAAIEDAAANPPLPDTVRAPSASAFPPLALDIPSDCVVEDMQPNGTVLYLRLGPALGVCEQILVIDITKGQQLGVIDLRP